MRKAVFTSEPLFDVMNRHGLYPTLVRKNPHAALDSFREDIDVEVRQNYFVEARPVGAAPRSALLVITYHNADHEVAVSVTRELGELVVNREQAARAAEARHAADLAKEQVDESREALEQRRSRVASLRAEIDRAPTADFRRRVEYIGLLGSLPALELAQDERERREASFALGAALEQRGAGIRFEVVSDGSLPSDAGMKSGRVLMAGAAFAFGVPLLAIFLGAFAPRRTIS